MKVNFPKTEEERLALRAHYKRAADRARAVLKYGDRITVTSCPGSKRWAIFDHWDGQWVCSKTRDDFSAFNISKINGVPVNFRDPGYEHDD